MGEDCASTQLIDGDGVFNVDGLERFLKSVRLANCGLSYAVVSIVGPQSSGKSTLLNHLFGTNFREMDALKGRSHTTKGIWIAKGVGIEPFTIVLDLEGTDGRERGEDGNSFEKQSALFALAISDIVLINMWCHDIGREHAANRPLLKMVFQVMMHLFSPRKTTLLFVIRDKTKTPLEHLELTLREDIQKIWDTVSKPQAHMETPLSEFFNVEVTALPSYEEKEELFKEQVAQLRQHFFHSIAPGGLAGDRRHVIPASGFSISIRRMWEVIQENKDLDLPAHKIMVATVRCEQIADEKLSCFTSDKGWLELEASVQAGLVSGFGRKLDSILDVYLSQYDMETIYFDDGVRAVKRLQLQSAALHLVHPAFQAMLGHLHSKALDRFKSDLKQSLKRRRGFATSVRTCTKAALHEFDAGFTDVAIQHSDWNASKIREQLCYDIEAHTASVRSVKLSELKAAYEKQITKALAEPLELVFDSATEDTWASIREFHKRETENALSGYSSALSDFELDQSTFDKMVVDLKDYARGVVVRKAREESGKVLMRMKDRFWTVFSHDKDSMPRVWTGKEDVRMITKVAHAAALKILAEMAAVRLDDQPDKIENILNSCLMDGPVIENRTIEASTDPLASSTWEGVPPCNTVITPVQCKSIWKQFKTETEYIVIHAIAAQEAHKGSNSWLLPPWAIVTIAILGFNEFMMLLRNPLYLVILVIVFLLSRTLWVDFNIAGEFRNRMLSGLLALPTRLLPSVMNILRRLADDGGHRHNQTPQNSQQAPSVNEHSLRNQTQRWPPWSIFSSDSDIE